MIKIIFAAIAFYAAALQNASSAITKLAEELKAIYAGLDDAVKAQLKHAVRMQLLALIEFKRAYKMLPADIKLTAPTGDGMEAITNAFIAEFDDGLDELTNEYRIEIEALTKA